MRPPTPTSKQTSNASVMADQSQIDPRLFASASSVPPRSQQLYASAPQQNTAHPYYLPSPTAQHHAQSQAQQPPQLSQLSQPAPLGTILDPTLEQTSPAGPEAAHDDDEHEDDGDHDGYVITPVPTRRQDRAQCFQSGTTGTVADAAFRRLCVAMNDIRTRLALLCACLRRCASSSAAERQSPKQDLAHRTQADCFE